MKKTFLIYSLIASVLFVGTQTNARAEQPTRIIFDTDMGNDIDDALALGVIHSLQSRGACQLLAVTVSKDNLMAAQYCDLVNHFYGRGHVPVGKVQNGKTKKSGKFLPPTVEATDNGQLRYPRRIKTDSDVPDATALLRKVLAHQPDKSVDIVVVGFSTNTARLLASKPDEHSPLDGKALVAKKVRLLSMMAGHYGKKRPKGFKEYNVVKDLDAAGSVFAGWPTPIIASGYEIGKAIKYPAASIQNDFNYVFHHPLKEGYEAYIKMPYDRPTWDLTSVLYAVYPDRGYFGLSDTGEFSIGEDGFAVHKTGGHGRHQFLTATEQQKARVLEALIQLASQPPHTAGSQKKSIAPTMNGMPLVFADDFESTATTNWEPTDKAAWEMQNQAGNAVYSLINRHSDFDPPVRSPHNRSLVKDVYMGNFVLDVQLQSTIKDYNHRDLCLFFGYQDDAHLYYVHLGKKMDPHANNIFIVNDEPRKSISITTTDGTNWDDSWHHARVVRKVETGEIEIYFDDMTKPVMTAKDKTFAWGRVGIGSFDDTGNFDQILVYGQKVDKP